MFDEKYYKDKQEKNVKKLQKLIDDTFNASAKLWADYYTERADLEQELIEIDKLIKKETNNMDEVQEEVAAEVVAEPAVEASEEVVAEEKAE